MRGTSEEDEDDEYVSEESEGDDEVPDEPDEEEEEEPYEEEIVPQVVVRHRCPAHFLPMHGDCCYGFVNLLHSRRARSWACCR